MDRFASLRFDEALDEPQRARAARAIGSAGGRVICWACDAERSYVALYAPPGLDGRNLATALGAARFDDPSLAVFAIRPRGRSQAANLLAMLIGPAAPIDICDARVVDGKNIIVEIEPGRVAVSHVLASIDDTFGTQTGRRVRAVLPLGDEILAAIAGARLREPDLDASRVLDRYVERLSAGASW